MDLEQLFAFADVHQPPQYALPVRLQPFLPDLVPALGAPCTFTAPPRPDGEPDFLGLTVLDEPALVQSDPASLALHLRHQAGVAGSGGSRSVASDAAPPLGWVADPAREAQRLNGWVEQVEALHQEDASAAALAPALPDLETLMQAWSPEMQAHIESSPLPDPQQDVDLPTFARMCCAVLDLQPPAVPAAGSRAWGAAAEQHCALLHSLHALFALYLEFRHDPAFQHLAAFEAAAAEQGDGAAAAEAEERDLNTRMQPAFSKVLSASYLTGAALGLPSALFSSVFPETRAVRLRNAAGQDWEGKVSVRLNREAMRVEVTSGWGMFAKANGLRAGEEVRIEFLPKDVLLVTVVNPAGAASGTTARAVTPAASQRGAQHSSSDGLAALAAAAAAGVSPNTQTAEQPPHSGHHKRSAPELEAAAQQDAQQNAQQEGQQEELRELEHQAYEGQQRTPKRQRQRSDPVALVAVAAAAAAAAHDAANAAAAAALVAANAAEQAAVAAAAAAAALGQG